MQTNITKTLSKYLSDRIPKYAMNIFYQMFNGIEATLETLDYKLNIVKRERNILTANQLASLRSLAAMNGFEPVLKVPSKGLLAVKISPKLFKKFGYPLYIKPYSVFENTINKLQYHYIGDKPIKVYNNTVLVPVVEGEIKTQKEISKGAYIERFYIADENIAENSIIVEVNGVQYQEVKSFFDNQGVNDDKQFMVKFSNNAQTPIVIYIINTKATDICNITYRLTFGENGNLDSQTDFETSDIVDSNGLEIMGEDDEISIINVSGFNFGSNGTDENALRASIGFNHGITLLFDVVSYTNFLNKYSTILIQKVLSQENQKTIKNLYISKKQTPSTDEISDSTIVSTHTISHYQHVINNKLYLFNSTEKQNLSTHISQHEFALTSHNIYDSKVCKYAFQITMGNQELVDTYSNSLSQLLYLEFFKFLYIKQYQVNIETLFTNFMNTHKIKFEYTIFNEIDEQNKISGQQNIVTSYVISHNDYLPILKGNFKIIDNTSKTFDLFFDVNIVAKS